MYIMKTTDELDIQYYIDRAQSFVGGTYDLLYRSPSLRGESAGTFTILDYEVIDPHFVYGVLANSLDPYEDPDHPDQPTGIKLGAYTVKIDGSKFYNGEVGRHEVESMVQTIYGPDDSIIVNSPGYGHDWGPGAYYFSPLR